VIKILATGGVLSAGDKPGAEQFTYEELKIAADEAHRAGRKIAAHAHGTQGIKDAVRAGIDSIEHGSLIDAEGIELMKEHGTYLDADIYNDGRLDVLMATNGGPAVLFRNEAASEASNRSLRVKLVGTKSNRDGIGVTVARY